MARRVIKYLQLKAHRTTDAVSRIIKKEKCIMKKIISVILVALMLTVLAVPAFADDAVAIKTAEEFMAMESGKSYYLANDIDFGGKVFDSYIISGSGFIVDLDGKGFALKNFSFNVENATGDVAMFQQFGGGTIKNLNIGSKDALIKYTIKDPKDSSSYAMLVASTGKDKEVAVRIENVNIYADMQLTYTNLDTRLNFGGFIAYARNYEIVSSSMNGQIIVKNESGEATRWRNVGGFIGSDKENWATGTIDGCTNNADITMMGSGKEGRVAGFVPYSGKKANIIKNSVNNGTLTLATSAGDGNLAGIMGCSEAAEATIEGCTNNGKLVYDCTNAEDAKAGTIAAGIIDIVKKGTLTVKNCANTVEIKTGAGVNSEIIGVVSEGITATEEGNRTSAEAVVTEPVTEPEDTTPAPSTGDHSMIIVALAAVMALAGAACAIIARRSKEV